MSGSWAECCLVYGAPTWEGALGRYHDIPRTNTMLSCSTVWPTYSYECQHEIEVGPPFCPDCGARVVAKPPKTDRRTN